MTTHPLLEGLERDGREITAPAMVMVVFGASGDLCSRKLLPALGTLAARGELPAGFSLVGVARTSLSDDEFRALARSAMARGHGSMPADETLFARLASGFRFVRGNYDDDETFVRLAEVLDELDGTTGAGGRRLFYLAVPPATFPEVIRGLSRPGCERSARRHQASFRPAARFCVRECALHRPVRSRSTTGFASSHVVHDPGGGGGSGSSDEVASLASGG